MRPQTTADFYAILEVPESADPDTIKSAYRRLARLRHPDKDAGNPQATANFQELQDAYSTLSDPLKRRDYDAIYPSIRPGPRASQDKGGNPWWASRPPTSHAPDTAEMRAHKQKLEELEKQLQRSSQQRTGLNNDLSDAKQKLATKQSTLERLRAEAAKDERDEAARKGWFGFFYRLTPERQEERDRSATARKTGQLVVEAQVEQCKSTVSSIKSRLNGVSIRIGQINSEVAATKRRYEQARLAEEQRLRAEQFRRECEAQMERQRQTKARQEAEAEARRKREEAAKAEGERWKAEQAKQLAEQARQRAEQARKARQEAEAEGERRKAEQAKKKAERAKQKAAKEAEARRKKEQARKPADEAQEKRKRATKARKQRTAQGSDGAKDTSTKEASSASNNSCRHKGWWEQIQGANRCQRCQNTMSRFALCCPGCGIMACADCCKILKRGATM